jgi:hypothetical protein
VALPSIEAMDRDSARWSKGLGRMNELERRWHRAMVSLYETAKRDLGYNATRFLQMVAEQGGLTTARQLISSAQPSEGFTTLWQRHRLDLTVEAHVLKPEFADLFTHVEREAARLRLEQYGWRPQTPTT